MSERGPILLVGATGVVGSLVMREVGRVRGPGLVALARRAVPAPPEVRIEVADPAQWAEAVSRIAPKAVICALGTTWRAAGRDEAAFRAVDHDLVVSVAEASREAGADRFVLVSSVSADPRGSTYYLRVKGDVEMAVSAVEFDRLDILRPGLLKARREGERRVKERLAMLASPLTDRLLHGGLRRFRSIDARVVAAAAVHLVGETEPGRYVHEYDGIALAAARLGVIA
jgi:uncharacterized protein YbjT (DUF2867 family)